MKAAYSYPIYLYCVLKETTLRPVLLMILIARYKVKRLIKILMVRIVGSTKDIIRFFIILPVKVQNCVNKNLNI